MIINYIYFCLYIRGSLRSLSDLFSCQTLVCFSFFQANPKFYQIYNFVEITLMHILYPVLISSSCYTFYSVQKWTQPSRAEWLHSTLRAVWWMRLLCNRRMLWWDRFTIKQPSTWEFCCRMSSSGSWRGEQEGERRQKTEDHKIDTSPALGPRLSVNLY